MEDSEDIWKKQNLIKCRYIIKESCMFIIDIV